MNALTTVLVVEADPDVRRMTAQLLAQEGFQPIEVSSGPKALELIENLSKENASPSVVLTDVRMPSPLNGFGLATQIRLRGLTVPIIFMSGGYQPELYPMVREISNSRLIAKPFDQQTLMQAIRDALESVPWAPPQEAMV